MPKLYCLILLVLSQLCVNAQDLFPPPAKLNQKEVPTYPLPDEFDSLHAVFFLDYAKPKIKNPEVFWLLNPKWVYRIDLVFTRYPYVLTDWRTDYNWLLAKRLENLNALDSTFFTRSDIEWNFVLQTDCKTEEEAKRFFHGFVMYMKPIEEVEPDTTHIPAKIIARKEPPTPPKPSEKLIRMAQKDETLKQMARVVYKWESPLQDSSVYKVFERHPQWIKKLVVMDWTASMYRNGSSVVRWQAQQMDDRAIKHMVLFNDGDNKAYAHKRIGKTGGIYHIQPDSVEEILNLMSAVKKRGMGGDAPENDMEALVKATRSLKGYGEVVLIPDRQSTVRDTRLIKYLKKPVRIIVFKNRYNKTGLKKNQNRGEDEWIHPHYLSIASISGGSLHTHNRDIYELAEMNPGDRITIGWYMYEKMGNGAFRFVNAESR